MPLHFYWFNRPLSVLQLRRARLHMQLAGRICISNSQPEASSCLCSCLPGPESGQHGQPWLLSKANRKHHRLHVGRQQVRASQVSLCNKAFLKVWFLSGNKPSHKASCLPARFWGARLLDGSSCQRMLAAASWSLAAYPSLSWRFETR